jgi:hypothetical protein
MGSIFSNIILIRKNTEIDIRENIFIVTFIITLFISVSFSRNLTKIKIDFSSVSTSRVVRSTNKVHIIIFT